MPDGSATTGQTTVERVSDREVLVTRTIKGPIHLVYKAFSQADLFRQWWVPKSMGMKLLSCEMDPLVGGTYRLTFDVGAPEPIAFFGTYVEVTPPTHLAWTNDEGGEMGSVTSVTFEDRGALTHIVLRETYQTKEALDAAGTGAQDAMFETFGQLEELLAELEAQGVR